MKDKLNLNEKMQEIAVCVNETILYHYGEKEWYKKSLEDRKNIIENIIRDISILYDLTESETKNIIEVEQKKDT